MTAVISVKFFGVRRLQYYLSGASTGGWKFLLSQAFPSLHHYDLYKDGLTLGLTLHINQDLSFSNQQFFFPSSWDCIYTPTFSFLHSGDLPHLFILFLWYVPAAFWYIFVMLVHSFSRWVLDYISLLVFILYHIYSYDFTKFSTPCHLYFGLSLLYFLLLGFFFSLH